MAKDAESQPEKGYPGAIPDPNPDEIIAPTIATHAEVEIEWPPYDGELYSIIITLSRATNGWLYDYANYDRGYPGFKLIGFPIWPENRPKVYKYWEPSDDKTETGA